MAITRRGEAAGRGVVAALMLDTKKVVSVPKNIQFEAFCPRNM
jgi:hypothetical protein